MFWGISHPIFLKPYLQAHCRLMDLYRDAVGMSLCHVVLWWNSNRRKSRKSNWRAPAAAASISIWESMSPYVPALLIFSIFLLCFKLFQFFILYFHFLDFSISSRQMVFSALTEPCRSFLARELVAHAEELRASRQGRGKAKQVLGSLEGRTCT